MICGGLWSFAVVCGHLQWFAMVCGGLSYSHTANHRPSSLGPIIRSLTEIGVEVHKPSPFTTGSYH